MTDQPAIAWPRSVFSRKRRADPLRSKIGAGDLELAADRFRLLVLPHLDAAYNYARYLARDATAAEDIVQDAFLRAWKGWHTCRGSEKAWLLAIVRNCYHDWNRVARGYCQSADTLEEIAEHAGDARTEEDLLHRFDLALLHDTITRLPEPFREVLVLRELEELSYREIASLTGAPIGTVMSRLARGRAMLGTLLLDHGQEGM